jgi:hypothetical protein
MQSNFLLFFEFEKKKSWLKKKKKFVNETNFLFFKNNSKSSRKKKTKTYQTLLVKNKKIFFCFVKCKKKCTFVCHLHVRYNLVHKNIHLHQGLKKLKIVSHKQYLHIFEFVLILELENHALFLFLIGQNHYPQNLRQHHFEIKLTYGYLNKKKKKN